MSSSDVSGAGRRMRRARAWQLGVALAASVLVLTLAGTTASFADRPRFDRGPERGFARGHERFDGRRGRERFDGRYGHDRYYPRIGVVVNALPDGYRPFWFHQRPYYFRGGSWYVAGEGGFMVTAPPIGLFVSVLPPFYSTVWFGGIPYYYANDVYYRWNPAMNGYIVSDPPAGAQPSAPAAPAPAANLYIYPKNGQSKSRQAADRFDCYSWSKQQTGFDPTQPYGGVSADQSAAKRQDYRRAMTACLEARGYSVH